jgi:uncharacterized protein (TIGR03435 family)
MMSRIRLLAAVVVLAPVAPPVWAQVAFDVASIKESQSLETGGTMRFTPDGGVRVQNLPVRSLITIAYQLQPYQLVNPPGWASETRYNIEAKPAANVPREQSYAMLQALLVERFRFAFHRERREVDGFALVRVRADRLGPDLKPSELNCEKDMATTPRCRQGGITIDTMTANGAPIWSLLQLVERGGAERRSLVDLYGPPGAARIAARTPPRDDGGRGRRSPRARHPGLTIDDG